MNATVHTLRLVWKRDGRDIRLGTCFHTARPIVGDLIAYTSDEAKGQTGVWRVVTVYHHPFMPHSPTWDSWQARGERPECLTYYWVEPAEGPWEP